MMCWNLCQAYLQEAYMMHILLNYVSGNNLWMRTKGPHTYMVMALDSCVK